MLMKKRVLRLNKNFESSSIQTEEVYAGFLQFNISAILSDIASKNSLCKRKEFI